MNIAKKEIFTKHLTLSPLKIGFSKNDVICVVYTFCFVDLNPYFQNKFLLDLNALKINVVSAKQNLVTMIFTPTVAFLNVPNVPFVLVTKWRR